MMILNKYSFLYLKREIESRSNSEELQILFEEFFERERWMTNGWMLMNSWMMDDWMMDDWMMDEWLRVTLD